MTDEELSALLGEDFRTRKPAEKDTLPPEQPETAENPAPQPEDHEDHEDQPAALPEAPAAQSPAGEPQESGIPEAETSAAPAEDVPQETPRTPEEEPFSADIGDIFDTPRPMPPQYPPETPYPDEPPYPAEMPHPEAEPFSGDPFAETAAEPVKVRRHTALGILLGLFAVLLLAAAIFCIIWDVSRGTTAGGAYRAGDIVQVELVQHEKPESDNTLADENGVYTIEGVAKAVMPSIVQIYTYADGEGIGSGSGIILTKDGYIATNAHVVNGADNYSVRLFDEANSETPYDAVLVGHDSKTDLAVLKISASGLTPAQLGDSDQVHLGETVCALGNPAGLSGSISMGIISGMNRKVRAQSTNFEMDCFQTDAAISPGNSGGALVNLCGQVIGITSSKYGSNAVFGGSYEGLGFAITINEALPIIKELMEKGYVSGRVRIGIQFYENSVAHDEAKAKGQTLPEALDGIGVQVIAISEDSDLRNTIMKPNDWILSMNGKEISDYDSINEAIAGLSAGDSVHCRCATIQENGKLKTYEIDFRLLEDKSGEY